MKLLAKLCAAAAAVLLQRCFVACCGVAV